jgi:hypothetical protein
MAMVVKFISSAAGELIMMDEAARPLLLAIGKECTAKGVLMKAEIPAALAALEKLLAKSAEDKPGGHGKPGEAGDEGDEGGAKKPVPVSLRQRAWPFMELLRRTAGSKKKDAHILWQAKADFGAV